MNLTLPHIPTIKLDHWERGALHGLHGLTSLEIGHAAFAASIAAKPALGLLGSLGQALHVGLAGVVVGTSTIKGARAVEAGGAAALITTQEGRGAVLGATGGALTLLPLLPAKLIGGGLLLASAANDFGAFSLLDAPGAAH